MSRNVRIYGGVAVIVVAFTVGLRMCTGVKSPAPLQAGAAPGEMPHGADVRLVETSVEPSQDRRAEQFAEPELVEQVPATEPEDPAADTFTLTVRVLDEHGAGLSDASVVVNVDVQAAHVTDATGECSATLTPARLALNLQNAEIAHADYATLVERVALSETEILAHAARREWTMSQGIRFACRVLDGDGRPIEGARVRARPPSPYSDPMGDWSADNMDAMDRGRNLSGMIGTATFSRTDADGQAVLTVKSGDYELLVWADRFLRWQSSTLQIIESNVERPLDVVLSPGAVVMGEVVMTDGTPIPNARAYLASMDAVVSGMSNQDGLLELAGIPTRSSYSVLLTHPDFAPLWRGDVQEGVFHEFAMDAGRSLRLRLRDSGSSAPISGHVDVTKVSRRDSYGDRFLLKNYDATDALESIGGLVEIGRIGTEVEGLTLTVAGYKQAAIDLVSSDSTGDESMDVRLEPLKQYTINVIDEHGKPIVGAKLRVEVVKRGADGVQRKYRSLHVHAASLDDSTFTVTSDLFDQEDEVLLSVTHYKYLYDPLHFPFKRAGDEPPSHVVMHCERQ